MSSSDIGAVEVKANGTGFDVLSGADYDSDDGSVASMGSVGWDTESTGTNVEIMSTGGSSVMDYDLDAVDAENEAELGRCVTGLDEIQEPDLRAVTYHEKPSVQVRKVIEATAIVLGLQPVKSTKGRQFMVVSRKGALAIVRGPRLKERMKEHTRESYYITDDGLQALTSYITNPLLEPEIVDQASPTAGIIWRWVRATYAKQLRKPLSRIIRLKRRVSRKRSMSRRLASRLKARNRTSSVERGSVRMSTDDDQSELSDQSLRDRLAGGRRGRSRGRYTSSSQDDDRSELARRLAARRKHISNRKAASSTEQSGNSSESRGNLADEERENSTTEEPSVSMHSVASDPAGAGRSRIPLMRKGDRSSVDDLGTPRQNGRGRGTPRSSSTDSRGYSSRMNSRHQRAQTQRKERAAEALARAHKLKKSGSSNGSGRTVGSGGKYYDLDGKPIPSYLRPTQITRVRAHPKLQKEKLPQRFPKYLIATASGWQVVAGAHPSPRVKPIHQQTIPEEEEHKSGRSRSSLDDLPGFKRSMDQLHSKFEREMNQSLKMLSKIESKERAKYAHVQSRLMEKTTSFKLRTQKPKKEVKVVKRELDPAVWSAAPPRFMQETSTWRSRNLPEAKEIEESKPPPKPLPRGTKDRTVWGAVQPRFMQNTTSYRKKLEPEKTEEEKALEAEELAKSQPKKSKDPMVWSNAPPRFMQGTTTWKLKGGKTPREEEEEEESSISISVRVQAKTKPKKDKRVWSDAPPRYMQSTTAWKSQHEKKTSEEEPKKVKKKKKRVSKSPSWGDSTPNFMRATNVSARRKKSDEKPLKPRKKSVKSVWESPSAPSFLKETALHEIRTGRREVKTTGWRNPNREEINLKARGVKGKKKKGRKSVSRATLQSMKRRTARLRKKLSNGKASSSDLETDSMMSEQSHDGLLSGKMMAKLGVAPASAAPSTASTPRVDSVSSVTKSHRSKIKRPGVLDPKKQRRRRKRKVLVGGRKKTNKTSSQSEDETSDVDSLTSTSVTSNSSMNLTRGLLKRKGGKKKSSRPSRRPGTAPRTGRIRQRPPLSSGSTSGSSVGRPRMRPSTASTAKPKRKGTAATRISKPHIAQRSAWGR